MNKPDSTTNNSSSAGDRRDAVFDYRALRLLMGVIAFSLPIAVSLISSESLSSISASYYTNSRDVFVGMLCIVGAFLFAYNGHKPPQKIASKIASIAAILVAFYPTSCNGCEPGFQSIIHFASAAVLFSILAYFCFAPFRENTRGKRGKRGRRSKIYFLCGTTMVACIVVIAIVKFTLPPHALEASRIVFWAEAIALFAFGIAWIVAGKVIPLLVDKDQALRLFSPDRNTA